MQLRNLFFLSLIAITLGFFCSSCLSQNHEADDYLLLFTSSSEDEQGYKDKNGKIVIEVGKYKMCMTDTFRTYAVVLIPEEGFLAIDRSENIMYHIFNFDNGPDYVSEGLFRIVKDKKIGYADMKTGAIVIEPMYACAYPFENGKAKVATVCREVEEGEYKQWKSDKWFYIDKSGKIIEE